MAVGQLRLPMVLRRLPQIALDSPYMAPWTDEECERLKQLVNTGASVARASVVLRRNMKSVQHQARKLGRPFPTSHVARRERQAKLDAAAKGTGPSNPIRMCRAR